MAFGKRDEQQSIGEQTQVNNVATRSEVLSVTSMTTTRPEVSLANLDALLDEEMKMALEGIDPRPPQIKVSREAQVFMMPDGTTTKQLTGIIIFNHKARGYWETEGQQLPTCSSMDGVSGTDENGVQHPCKACRFGGESAWGTGKDGRGKTCKEMRWIYLLQDDEIVPSRISLPPTSLSEFDRFISALVQKRKAPISKVVRLGLEKTERHGFSYSTLAQPEVLGDVPPERIIQILKLRDTAVAAAQRAEITAEDYDTGDDDGGGGSGNENCEAIGSQLY